MPDKLKFPPSGKSGPLKQPAPNSQIQLSKISILLFLSLLILVLSVFVVVMPRFLQKNSTLSNTPKNKFADILVTPSPISSPTPSPSPKPLTFSEMNDLYGPCVRLPVLMYHHVQSQDSAKADKQTSLTVYTDYFEKQMQYLKDKGYNVVSVNDLNNFFDNGTKIPVRSVLITFDDAYEDFYTDAYPILQRLGFPATMFVPTGLTGGYDYLTWDQMSSMKGLILFANHTWSHKNVKTTNSDMQYEISTADTQLSDHGLNNPKTFAYPYGIDSNASENYLSSLSYKTAFTTVPGSTLCKKQRLFLPRIRIGNSPLSTYGF